MFTVLRRLAVLLFSVTAVFFALRILPGDAITAQLIESGADQQAISSRINELRLNEPVLEQYFGYLFDIMRGQWGISFNTGLPVFDVVLPPMLQTLIITVASLIGASFLGIGIGIISTLTTGIIEHLSKLILFLSISLPVFVTSILLLVLLGSADNKLYILPILVLTFHGAGTIGRVTYTVLDKHLSLAFVHTAFAKGLKQQQVIVHHVIPASMVPIIAVVALQFSFLISGTVIVETLFGINGIGRLIYNSTLRRDYPVVQAAVIVVAFWITLVNAVADLLYRVFDPRLRWH